MSEIKSNTCPYCGGPYTVQSTCKGPRTDNRALENRCEEMLRHEALIRAALEDARPEDEVLPRH